jgi:hypothetical protein
MYEYKSFSERYKEIVQKRIHTMEMELVSIWQSAHAQEDKVAKEQMIQHYWNVYAQFKKSREFLYSITLANYAVL